VKILAGTSGYAFKEWKGNFYPTELKDDGFLGYYATKFPTVEINNTFYRLPKENVLMEWAAQVPQNFTFALKASQRITHHARLKEEAADTVDFLLRNTAKLGDRLGPILFQLPPNLKKDVSRFRGFLGLLPSDRRYVFEFRHESWFDDEVFDAMVRRVTRTRHRDVRRRAGRLQVPGGVHRDVGVPPPPQARLPDERTYGLGEVRVVSAVEGRLRVLQARRDGERWLGSAGGLDLRQRVQLLASTARDR